MNLQNSLQSLDSLKLSCFKKEDPYQKMSCLKPYLEQKTYLTSAKEVVAETVSWKNEGIIPTCHLVGHYIGNANLVKNNFDVGKAIVSCSSSCDEGCIHGVMEGYIGRSKNIDEALANAPKLCDSVSNNEDRIKRQCYHGLGHGIMRHNATTIEEAINLCNKIQDQKGAFTCSSAAFMEYVFDNLSSNEKLFTDKLPTICKSLPNSSNEQWLPNCIFQIGAAISIHVENNEQEGIKLCNYLPTEYQKLCIESVQTQIKTNSKES